MLLRVFAAATLIATPLIANQPERADLLMKLIRANGCQMTSVEADEILPQRGSPMDETRIVFLSWIPDGLVEMHEFEGIKLSDKGCQGA
ncbi:hypothetical protein shim_16750 [Shimia sp. SK013]|uniref:hypothetical protein n=1 Tax=Shimia sp. SK013 TaxID=1389006 RepID=UPI0006B676F4|nr:hypothetical protein [Shimia sp. SK013]KPA22228.1 hypothetical protein shim_16750 [Shimia sp. SK013]